MAKIEILQKDDRSVWERIPEKTPALWEEIKSGYITDLILDTETVSLSKHFGDLTAYGVRIVNPLLSRLVKRKRLSVKIPDHVTMGFIPAMITERHPDTFSKGMDPSIAAAEIYKDIKNATRVMARSYRYFAQEIMDHNKDCASDEYIPVPFPDAEDPDEMFERRVEYASSRNTATKAERKAGIKPENKNQTSAQKAIYVPLKNEKGEIVYDYALSKDGKWIYYKEGQTRDGQDIWHRVPHRKTIMIMNSRADNNWLWNMFHRYLMPKLFITHVKQEGARLLDTLPLTREVVKLGPQDRTRLVPGVRPDGSLSFAKDAIMEANTRLGSERLYIPDGVTMDDGSWHDKRQTHVDPEIDVANEYAIYQYAKKIAPDIVEYKRKLSDSDYIRRSLIEGNESGAPPVISFIRNRYPYCEAHMGVMLNTDRAYGDFKRGIGICLDVLREDPSDPARLLIPDGRNLFDLSEDDLVQLMKRQEKDPLGVFEIFNLQRCPSIQPAETGMKRGANHGVSWDSLQTRRDVIHHMGLQGFRAKISNAFERYVQTFDPVEIVADPKPEERVFQNRISPTRRAPIIRKDWREQKSMTDTVFKRYEDQVTFYLKRNEHLMHLLCRHPNLEGKHPKDEAYEELAEELERVSAALIRQQTTADILDFARDHTAPQKIYLPQKAPFKNNGQAVEFLWKLRQKALAEHWLVAPSPDHYWVIDRQTGREIPQSRLSDIPYDEFGRLFDVKNKKGWDINFERFDTFDVFMAEIFMEAGREAQLMEVHPDWIKRIKRASPSAVTDHLLWMPPINVYPLLKESFRSSRPSNGIRAMKICCGFSHQTRTPPAGCTISLCLKFRGVSS
ncbi:MAG: hypothetical protein LRY76_03400 [Alphaproteobacteria bacterium]|nr:hypothetical protein [Alphaproteobacteria bacterium]